MQIDKLSVKELREIQSKIPAVIAAKAREELAEVKAKMAALAAKQGYSMSEIVGPALAKRRGKAAAVKYRSPDGKTWAGRGRRPRWMEGKDPEQFRVK